MFIYTTRLFYPELIFTHS